MPITDPCTVQGLTPEECANVGEHEFRLADIQVFNECTTDAQIGDTHLLNVTFTESGFETNATRYTRQSANTFSRIYEGEYASEAEEGWATMLTFIPVGYIRETLFKGQACVRNTYERLP
ncbi:MAG: hypothetical protein HYZ26_12850 [Chloroflexi bacterium]|nr:hypothetical protein [Chloroflexota bacterium]